MINNATANTAPGTHRISISEVKKVERLLIVGSTSVIILKENCTISQPVPTLKNPLTVLNLSAYDHGEILYNTFAIIFLL